MTDPRYAGDDTYLAALAGLLHDVGKFAQRAGVVPDSASQAFTPDDYGNHGAHAKWSISFIHEHVPQPWRAGLSPVLYHHWPRDRVSKVVALADRLSAAEREGSGEAGAKQLISVFCKIGDASERPPDQVWPLAAQHLSETAIFPREAVGERDEKAAYARLWSDFEQAAAALPKDDLGAYIEGLQFALQRFAWCVPGAYYRSVPDVSLYDHSRTTAALAACMVGTDEELLDELLDRERQEEPVALLVGGDISGVQDFIYTITARGAAKGLRGRSFYLQLLTEAVVRFILRELGLPATNLIYAGGGHLYLLAPVDAAVRLEELRALVSRKLLDHHGGDLYLALGWSKLAAQDFAQDKFGEAWQRASGAMNAAKRRRFSELDDAGMLVQDVFGPLGTGGNEEGECQVCHYDGHVDTDTDSRGETRRVCRLCKSLEELGGDLRDARYMVLAELPARDSERGGYRETLESFGLGVGLLDAQGRAIGQLPRNPVRATLLAMDDSGDAQRVAAVLADRIHCPVAAGTRYTVNVTPRKDDGEVATFDWLQEQSTGVQRLGVLRMDVDDLGDLFAWGMKGAATISRVAALSSALSLYFEGWVGELCRVINHEQGERVYAIYSGGDDLFIVGAWDALPDLADRIRLGLARFTAGNPAVHISGGLTLHGGKYPLYQAAQDAERALEAAKDLVREDKRPKNAFNFLGLTIPWEEYEKILDERTALIELVEVSGANRAVLRTLLQLHARATQAEHERGKPYWGPWMWQCAYRLTRMAKRNSGEVATEIDRLRRSLSNDGFRYIEVLGPAARWAELLIRKEQGDGTK